MEQEKNIIESGLVKKQRPCPVCLEMIDEDVTICPYCDEPTHFGHEHQHRESPVVADAAVDEKPAKGMSLWKKVLIGVGCVFAALFVIGLLLPDDDEAESEDVELAEAMAAVADEDPFLAETESDTAEEESDVYHGIEDYDDNESDEVSLYELLDSGNDDISAPTWKARLIKLVGESNYMFMCEQYMGSSIQREEGMMGRYASFSFEGHTKENWNDGYVIEYACGDGHEHLEVKITRNGQTKTYEETN